VTASGSALDIASTYYMQMPERSTYAIDDVAAATRANVVVNYPNLRVLNPLGLLTRAEAAAFVSALVRLGQVQPC